MDCPNVDRKYTGISYIHVLIILLVLAMLQCTIMGDFKSENIKMYIKCTNFEKMLIFDYHFPAYNPVDVKMIKRHTTDIF